MSANEPRSPSYDVADQVTAATSTSRAAPRGNDFRGTSAVYPAGSGAAPGGGLALGVSSSPSAAATTAAGADDDDFVSVPTTREAQRTPRNAPVSRDSSDPPLRSHHFWPPESSQLWQGRMQHDLGNAGGHTPANRQVRFAWEPLAGAEDNDDHDVGGGNSSTAAAYSPLPSDGRIPGTRGSSSDTLGPIQQGCKQLGMKRFRASDGHSSRVDEQDREAKRVGSPYRLIRRVPVTPSNHGGPSPALPRHSYLPLPRNTDSAAGAGSSANRVPGAASADPNDAVRRTWAADSNVSGGPTIDRGRAAWVQETGGRHGYSAGDRGRSSGRGGRGSGSSWEGVAAADARARQGTGPRQLHFPGDAAASGGAAAAVSSRQKHGEVYTSTTSSSGGGGSSSSSSSSSSAADTRTLHDSLKAQRLNIGHMDSLTNGVNNLGVISPGTPGSDGVHQSSEPTSTSRREQVWRRQTRSGGSANSTALAAASFRPTSAHLVGAPNHNTNDISVDNLVNSSINDAAGHRAREVLEMRNVEVRSTIRHYGNEQPKRRRGDLPSRGIASSR